MTTIQILWYNILGEGIFMDNFQGQGFDLSPELLDLIQGNIEEIIKSFPISESNKKDVL